MFRALLVLAGACAVLATATPSAVASKPCVTHGREIRNRDNVSCSTAKSIANYYFGHAQSMAGWVCQGQHGQFWRGYCDFADGVRYFTWRPLS